MKLTPIQRAALEHIERDGRWHGMHGQTINSLKRRGLVEMATLGQPHPTSDNAFWRLTEDGKQAIA